MQKANLKQSVENLLRSLKDKERDVLKLRFGLFGGNAKTLATIGKNLGLTRERIRQIQNSAIKKIKDSKLQEKEEIFSHVIKATKENGGVIHIDEVSKLTDGKTNEAIFVLESHLQLNKIKGQKSLNNVYLHKELDEKNVINAEKEIIAVLEENKKARGVKKIYQEYADSKNDALDIRTIKTLLEFSESFSKDWNGRFGLSSWREVNPKSARDKAYFVMKKIDRPIHFTHIALEIEKEDLRGKNPTAATVHNELILDERFVLVGRGIYALKEWGFTGGTVEDVIEEVLKKNPNGLEREDIIEKVLKTKMVAKNTIVMNLLVKEKFKKNTNGLYKLVK